MFCKQQFRDWFIGKHVLDVGSGDINGAVRGLFEDCSYEGNDVVEGTNVTIVSRTKDLPFTPDSFDTIVSTECFEHDPEYDRSWRKIYDLLKPGGLFCFTCASTGRPEHGTRTNDADALFGTTAGFDDMQDYYQNITEQHLFQVFGDVDTAFSVWDTYYNAHSCDLYLWGFKAHPRPIYKADHVMRTSHHHLMDSASCTGGGF
jgi:SAM-dependent methyltransferase